MRTRQVRALTDMCISAFFAFLGWRLPEDKLMPFDSACKSLDVQVDLSSAKLGAVCVSNTEERVAELTLAISDIVKAGVLSRKDGERFRGRLQFANAQLFGRSMRRSFRDLGKHTS